MKKIILFALIVLLAGCNNTGKQTTTAGEQKTEAGGSTNGTEKKLPGSSTDGADSIIAAKTSSNGPHDNLLNPDDSKTGATAVAAGNQPSEGNAGGTVTPATSEGFTGDNSTPDTPGDGKTIVFVGIFAQWKTNAGELFDGSYDTTHHLFVFCATDSCKPVPESEVQFPQFGSCDFALDSRLKLFRIQKNGSVDPLGSKIKLVGSKGFIKVNGILKPVQFDAPTIKRINKAKIIAKPQTPHQLVQPVKIQKGLIEDKTEIQKNNFIRPAEKAIMVNPGIDAAKDNTTLKPAVKAVATVLAKPAVSSAVAPQKTIEQSAIKKEKLQSVPEKEIRQTIPAKPEMKQQTLLPTKKTDTVKAVRKVTLLKRASPN
jgi:hypothetical protein